MIRLLTLAFLFAVWLFGAVNINTATSEELTALKGIGDTKAAAIVKWREENGGFKSIDELTQVKGIGKKTLESLKEEITISDE
ncbi:MAG: helix-hairpin-helix domain-containing protein [Helicobacteraceae bacterium]|jgi:competence protein ComEA|nr:helix-hairpin-helix domain-containing protein [Helicobacteraceae bacterium]